MANYQRICFDRILPADLRRARVLTYNAEGKRVRAAFEISKLWANGSRLRIRFMGGSSDEQDIVRQYASEWTQYANLKFDFGSSPDAEIRIAFQQGAGSWSYIGKDNLGIPRESPTMNFGWLDQGVVLHEFGHAIGLIHEHQNPLGGIQWNKERVYRDLAGPPNFWDRETVDHNLFAVYERDQINGTELDRKSIMLYSIPAEWTLDGFFSEPNDVLSETDRSFAGDPRNYPFLEDEEEEGLKVITVGGEPLEGSIGTAGEEDLYEMDVAETGSYVIETAGSTDVVMSLFGPDSRTALIAQDDDSGPALNSRIVQRLNPGKYFVQVRHYSSRRTGAYEIKASRRTTGHAMGA